MLVKLSVWYEYTHHFSPQIATAISKRKFGNTVLGCIRVVGNSYAICDCRGFLGHPSLSTTTNRLRREIAVGCICSSTTHVCAIGCRSSLDPLDLSKEVERTKMLLSEVNLNGISDNVTGHQLLRKELGRSCI